MSQRFEGRNLDDALEHAAQTLEVERWQLTYHVLVEKRGFLGGVKRVVIEADINTDAPPPAQQTALAADHSSTTHRERKPRSGGHGGERGARGTGERGRGDRGRGDRERGGGRRGGRAESRRRPPETFIGDLPEQTPESEVATAVREWCETLLRLAKLDLVLRTEENDAQIVVRLYGSDAELLTDRHGELLDAIQVLANKAFIGRRTEKDIELDCEDFKARRNEDLAQRARDAADRVRGGGREELLPTMAPIERRIIHLALQDDADVTTESRGEGFFKRVAIVRRSAPVAEPPDVQEP
jgi:predicted RNA-binding protein Jag